MTVWVMAIDVGTTNGKVEVFDEKGRSRGEPLKTRLPVAPDGSADPDELAEGVEGLIDRALTASSRTPDAVALTGAWHGLVGLDAAARPVGRSSSWLDTRAGEEALFLRERVADAEALHRCTGGHLHPSFPPARLLWSVRHEPEAFARVARWCALPEFLEVRWFGTDVRPSLSVVSAGGMYDQLRGRYHPEILDIISLDPATLVDPLGCPGRPEAPLPARAGRLGLPLRPEFARRWPALAGVPWLPAVGDGAAALLGSGCRPEPGCEPRAALTVGTSAAVRVLVPWHLRAARELPEPLFAYLLDAERAVVGVARSNAGSLVSWARRVVRMGLAGDAHTDPVELATSGRLPGSHGLSTDASLGGERSPAWPPRARGSLAGLNYGTTGLDILQALLEDSVLGLARSVSALEQWAGPVRLVLSGGGGRSQGWKHLLADALGRPIAVSTTLEASARGAALMALEALGWDDQDAWEPNDAEVVEPDPERARRFAALL
jgi:gluconokinase